MANIFMLIHNETIIGSVGCYGTEIDDLIVNKEFQHKGYGTTLLLWAICHIRAYTDEPITIHVAEWKLWELFLSYNSENVVNGAKMVAISIMEKGEGEEMISNSRISVCRMQDFMYNVGELSYPI